MTVTGHDEQLATLIGRVLRAGVVASSVCLAVGLAVAATSPRASSWLLHAGIVVLIATPGARVVLSMMEYVRWRDWTFVITTSIVLLELAASVVAALIFHRRL
jgi:uncharacterized membrane protein